MLSTLLIKHTTCVITYKNDTKNKKLRSPLLVTLVIGLHRGRGQHSDFWNVMISKESLALCMSLSSLLGRLSERILKPKAKNNEVTIGEIV